MESYILLQLCIIMKKLIYHSTLYKVYDQINETSNFSLVFGVDGNFWVGLETFLNLKNGLKHVIISN